MKDQRIALINYLTAEGHPERHELFRVIVNKADLATAHDDYIKAVIETWMEKTAPCKEGVARFQKIFPELLPVLFKSYKYEVTVVGRDDCGNIANIIDMGGAVRSGIRSWRSNVHTHDDVKVSVRLLENKDG